MGDYSVPEEIRKMKPRGSAIKVIKGNYYVYSNSRHKDPETGKWKTDPGKLLGKIIPSVGFLPRESRSEKEGITCFEYGEYLLACRLAKEEFLLLRDCFGAEEAFQIFSLACIFVFEGYIGLRPSESIYERCLIAHDYPDLKYSYHRLSELLSRIGRGEGMMEFQRKCLDGSHTVAVDGHVIPSDSEKSDLSYNGYKAEEVKGEQMNLLVALDVDSHLPLAARVFPGYMVDKADVQEFLEPLGAMEGKLFIMDMGFYSSDNVSWLLEKKADYIMPLSSNLESYKAAAKPERGRLAQFLCSGSGKKTDLVEYREAKGKDGKRVIFFRNLSEKEKLMKEYLKKMEEGAKGHTEEGLKKAMGGFGVIVLETSLKTDAKEIYGYYKTRWAIETYYDRIKNQISFKELNLSEYGMIQAIAFTMLVSGRIDQKILKASREVHKTSRDLIRLMSALKLFDNGKSMSVCNAKKEHLEVAKALGLSFDLTKKCLD